MSVALSSSDSGVINRQVSPNDENLNLGAKLEDVFEIGRCAEWTLKNELNKVTLQFPDGLMTYAPKVADVLQTRLGKRFAILGDTSYGECCVDEVAAEHLGSDGVIHFGNSCLTPTQRLPVLLIFTAIQIDVGILGEKLAKLRKEEEGKRIHLFYDVRFHSAITGGRKSLLESTTNLDICEPPLEPNLESRCGRTCREQVRDDDVVIYCGNNDKYALLLALTFNKCKQVTYDPAKKSLSSTCANIGKVLMQRFYLIEKVRDATRIGVLVGTLGVSRYRTIIDHVLSSIKASGKRAYTFLVGKPNVPKLANFPEVEVFVLVACPENSLVGAKEFMQPVVTPFELDVALNTAREWTGDFHADFHDLLPGSDAFQDFVKPNKHSTDVSLITGKLRSAAVTKDDDETSSRAVMGQETTLSVLHRGGGGEFLSERTWQGLEQKLGETPVGKAIKGQSGIAMGYTGEGGNEESK
jgi:diphthamide biosynthesis protein 2